MKRYFLLAVLLFAAAPLVRRFDYLHHLGTSIQSFQDDNE